MKAILEFSLPKEQGSFDMAYKAGAAYLVIHKVDEYLRSKIKYADDTVSPDTLDALQKVRDHLYELMNENDVRT